MMAYGIDIIPDVWVRTVFAERALGNDELRIIGGWRNQFRGTALAAPGVRSFADLKGKRIGDWYTGGIATFWWEHQLRQAGWTPSGTWTGGSATATARCVSPGRCSAPARPMLPS